MFFARAVGGNGKVVTYEPNPANYRCIGDQVKLNGFSNVRVRQVGLGATGGAASLVFSPSDPGRGSVSEVLTKSTLGHADAVTVPVELDSMDHQIAAFGQPVPDFVKIDVEGFEFEVLNGMTDTIERRRPALFVEIHGTDSQDKMRNARRVVHFLIARRYSLYHVESRGGIDATNAETAKEGHLYCEARAALGTPSDRARL